MLLLGRNKVPGRIKQGGGPDSAHGPCACQLCLRPKCLEKQFVRALSTLTNEGAASEKLKPSEHMYWAGDSGVRCWVGVQAL